MARPARTTSRVRGCAPRGHGARLAITFFALLAFTLQTYVTQTHIHGVSPVNFAATTSALDGSAAQKHLPDKLPPSNDPANCPICQEILHSGHYVTPSATVLLLPIAAAFTIASIVEIVTIAAVYSHGWKSRAPPLV